MYEDLFFPLVSYNEALDSSTFLWAVIYLNIMIPKLGQAKQSLSFFASYFFWVNESIIGRPEDDPPLVDTSNLCYARATAHLNAPHL